MLVIFFLNQHTGYTGQRTLRINTSCREKDMNRSKIQNDPKSTIPNSSAVSGFPDSAKMTFLGGKRHCVTERKSTDAGLA